MSKLKETKSPSAIQFRKCKVVKLDSNSKFQSKFQPKLHQKCNRPLLYNTDATLTMQKVKSSKEGENV